MAAHCSPLPIPTLSLGPGLFLSSPGPVRINASPDRYVMAAGGRESVHVDVGDQRNLEAVGKGIPLHVDEGKELVLHVKEPALLFLFKEADVLKLGKAGHSEYPLSSKQALADDALCKCQRI